jgi:hypothetical protein
VRAVSVATAAVELDAVDGGEQRPNLLRRERERRRPDLGEPALGAQPRDPQARDGARDQHEADVLRERVDRDVERPQTMLVGDHLQVVEHDHERSPVGGERVGEGVDCRPCVGGGTLQEAERVTPGARPRPRHRRGHGGPEAHEVVSLACSGTEAAVCPRASLHVATATDLPEPAGAATSVAEARQPSSSATRRAGARRSHAAATA